jgi:hypothetical protein
MLANAESNDEDNTDVNPVIDRELEKARHTASVAVANEETAAWERENHLERHAKVKRDKEVNRMHANNGMRIVAT